MNNFPRLVKVEYSRMKEYEDNADYVSVSDSCGSISSKFAHLIDYTPRLAVVNLYEPQVLSLMPNSVNEEVKQDVN